MALAEVGSDLFQTLVGSGNKMVPGDHPHLAPLREDRRLANREEAQQTSSGCGFDELAARQRLRSQYLPVDAVILVNLPVVDHH
jgi:hypothetical protein